MLCKKPYMQGIRAFGCGQCTPCRINRNREWSHRMMLESFKHETNSFVTITYDDEHLPAGGTLVPTDLRSFIKRLRFRLAPRRMRYYACGEYGERSGRPHYHLALFGVGLEDEQDILQAWHSPKTGRLQGYVHVGTLTMDSAQYLAKYIQKGLTKVGMAQLDNRHPEFARMSNRPGIAGLAVPDISDALTTSSGAELIAQRGDVPTSLKHGKRSMPLGRYLRRKLREHIGLDEEKIKKDNLEKWSQTVHLMLEEADRASTTPQERFEKRRDVFSNKQKILNIETKAKIFKKGGTL